MGTDAAKKTMAIELAYAEPTRQWLINLTLSVGCTARQALLASELIDLYPHWRESMPPLGVWGQRVDAEHVLRDGDRLEVYRPLSMDPKSARKKRVQTQPKPAR